MKILQVSATFYPALKYGGPVSVSYTISKGLAKKGHEVTVLTTDAYDYKRRLNVTKDYYLLDGIKVKYCKNLFYLPFLHDLIAPEIISAFKKLVPFFDIIHLHDYRNFVGSIVAYLAKKYKIPYVMHLHGQLTYVAGRGFHKRIFDKIIGLKILLNASKLIALNNLEAEQLRCMGVPEEKIEIIPNGIDLSEFGDLPPKGSFKKRFSIDMDEKIVLYLGRIHQIKGIDILVKAFATVIRKLEDVRLVVVGPDEGYHGELEALIKALKIEDNVLILGPLYGKDKLKAYVNADVYVLPSRYEIWGMTVLEAMACGTPIILSENCGISEVVRDKVGLVVSPSPANLDKALLRILTDEKLQRKFRENCKRTVKRFDLANHISKLERIYEGVINE